jgi:outer membrane protein assembly factor BamB
MKAILVCLLGLGSILAPAGGPGWPQWGGPSRNFIAPEAPLALAWPADGPRILWRRPLGDGFSAIVSDGATLYTAYRDRSDDVIIAINAADGRTVWESRYAAPFNETCSERLGQAPRAAPLIAGDRLITVSAGAQMNSFDRRTGRKLWTLELVPAGSDAGKPCGYASSPVAFKNTIITMAGGPGRGVVAVDAKTGREIWAAHDFLNGYSSPLLIDLDGRPELIVFSAGEISGLNPETGALDWTHPHPADFGVNVAMPIWGDDHLLFVSSAYNGGSRVLKLARTGSSVSVSEQWANKRVRIHFGNAVRLGDRVYASNGDFGAAPFAAIDIRTGDMAWRDRGVARSTLIGVGSRLIILDEDGRLTLATPAADGLTVHGRAQVFSGRSWTVPTLVGTTLFARDRKEIVALDLGR